jgi:hypothetical protein
MVRPAGCGHGQRRPPDVQVSGFSSVPVPHSAGSARRQLFRRRSSY